MERWSSRLWKTICKMYELEPGTLCGELPTEDFFVDIIQVEHDRFKLQRDQEELS